MSEALEVIEGEVMGAELEVQTGTLFHTDDPNEIIGKATATANALAEVIRQKSLATQIKGREHVRVEGWTLLGSMLGVFAVCTETTKLDDGWSARVEARTLSGAVVGAAEAVCLRSEKTWEKRDDYALCSMAQTRATSKALRQPLGFVMTLAGFAETPAEEMPRDFVEPQQPPQTQEQRDELSKIVRHLEELAPSVLREEDWATTLRSFTEEKFSKSESKALTKDEMDSLIVYALDLTQTEVPRSAG